MCPDDELLSAYIDGELTPELLDQVEADLAGSSEVRARLEEFEAMSEALHMEPEPDFEAARMRVWQSIQSAKDQLPEQDIFHKRVSIPMPLAAAAAFVILIAGALLSYFAIGTGLFQSEAQMAHATGNVTVHIEEGEDLSALLQALNSGDRVRQVSIEMPENARFAYQGEARLIRAVEMSSSFGGR